MFKFTARRGLLASLVVAGSLVGANVASAATPLHYQLTKIEKKNACGNFGGTIVYSDGSSLDCHTGVATLPVENES